MKVEEMLIKSCNADNLPEPYNLYAELIGVDKLYMYQRIRKTTLYSKHSVC